MEKIIKSCDCSVEEFYGAIQELSQKDETSQFYVHMLLSVAEYPAFLMMMKDYKIKQKSQAWGLNSSTDDGMNDTRCMTTDLAKHNKSFFCFL